MSWETRRKFLYAIATLITVVAISVYLVRDTIFPAPTCTDKKQNGYEVGIDCGDGCIFRCSSEVVPLVVLWTRAIKSSKTTYDLVSMISNKNINNASKGVSYTFFAYNAQGEVMKEIKGSTIAPVDGDFTIIRQSITLPQEPVTVTIELQDGPHYKVHEKPTSPTLRITRERYEAGSIPRVYATIANTKRTTITDLPVHVVLFDQDNNAYAVAQTLIPRLDKEEIKEVSFTWDSPLPSAPVRIRVYPIFNPFVSIE